MMFRPAKVSEKSESAKQFHENLNNPRLIWGIEGFALTLQL
jgi:hypothetical protein